MDEGPFRAPRPTDRRGVSKPESSYRQPEESQQPQPVQPVKEEPEIVREPVAVSNPPVKEEKKRVSWRPGSPTGSRGPRFLLPIIIVVIVIVLAVDGFFLWSNSQNTGPTGINTSEYQAVFLTNGQSYFGKLQALNGQAMKLTDIYYPQTQTTTSDSGTSTDQKSIQLIKLGNEIQGPEDEMIIPKTQILFYENLKPSGMVVQAIQKYQKSH